MTAVLRSRSTDDGVQEPGMDDRRLFRERGHVVQEGGRRAPAEAVEGVHGGGGAAHGGAGPGAVGAARVGRRPGLGPGRGQAGRAGRTVSVHDRRRPGPGQGLLRGPVVADRPEQGRLRGRRDVRRAPGRPAAPGSRPRRRPGLPVPDRALRFRPVPGAAPVPGGHQVRSVDPPPPSFAIFP